MKVQRKILRDAQEPFNIPDELFKGYCRLNKVIVIKVKDKIKYRFILENKEI